MSSPFEFMGEDFNEIRMGPVEPMAGTAQCFDCGRTWARTCMQEIAPRTRHVRIGPDDYERREVPAWLCPECKVIDV